MYTLKEIISNQDLAMEVVYNNRGVKPEPKPKKKNKAELYKEKCDEIREKLEKDEDYLIQSLLKLYYLHDTHTYPDGDTLHHDLKGFNRVDKDFLCSVAEHYIEKKWLSPKQIACVRKQMMKYAGQLF